MTTENTIETTENVKRAKESASYNTAEMSFQCGGVKRILTLDKNHELFMRLALIGARNVVIDSVAGLAVKSGFTPEQRNDGMMKTMTAINDGKHVEREKTDKGSSIKFSVLWAVMDADGIRELQRLC